MYHIIKFMPIHSFDLLPYLHSPQNKLTVVLLDLSLFFHIQQQIGS